MKSIIAILLLISIGANAQIKLLVGTYTGKGSKGIYYYQLDTLAKKATLLSNTENVANPSYITIDKSKQFIYAVNEGEQGTISSFSLIDNKIQFINKEKTNGADPCYITLSPDQKNILVANYTGGSISQFYKMADGSISPLRQIIQHKGYSIIPSRQSSAHVHGTFFSPNGQYLLTPDLGMDEISIYPFNKNATPPIQEAKANIIKSTEGAGPRHLCFSKDSRFLYVMEELSGSIAVYTFNKGKATFLQRVFTHNADYKKQNGSADIHLSPNGKYLYASNRAYENTITKFKVSVDGKLNEKSMINFDCGGIGPRNFTITSDGKYLLVANQNTDNIVFFNINPINGDLMKTNWNISVSMPVCLITW
jgi:6-phosphogluconolactonase